MTGPQPNPIHDLEAEAAEQATHAEETHGGAPYTGDMPERPRAGRPLPPRAGRAGPGRRRGRPVTDPRPGLASGPASPSTATTAASPSPRPRRAQPAARTCPASGTRPANRTPPPPRSWPTRASHRTDRPGCVSGVRRNVLMRPGPRSRPVTLRLLTQTIAVAAGFEAAPVCDRLLAGGRRRELGHDLEASVVFPVGGEVLPSFDLGEGPLGPAVDGGEEADEEVDGVGADVDLVLQHGPAVQELLFDGAAEAQHLLGVVAHLLQGGDELLFGAQRGDEQPDHGLEVHRERRYRGAEPLAQHLPTGVGDRVHGPWPFPTYSRLAATSPMAASRLTSR